MTTCVRTYVSVGRTTTESSLTDRVDFLLGNHREHDHNQADVQQETATAPSSLTSLCVRVVAGHFASKPAPLETLSISTAERVVSQLPTTMDPRISVPFVHDENYWKRVCAERFGGGGELGRCRLEEHGLSWKRLFCERYARERLETFHEESEDRGDFESLLETLSCLQDYVFTLKFERLPSRVELDKICATLPNLIRLDFRYGAAVMKANKANNSNNSNKSIEYYSRTFGIKLRDAYCLSRTMSSLQCLTSLALSNNRIDDDVLMTLVDAMTTGPNPTTTTIVSLDISHNRVTTNGLRRLANAFLDDSENDPVLTDLNVADNRIHAEGGRCLGRLLRQSSCPLQRLDVRLNRLVDAGGRMLLDGLRDGRNRALLSLNLSSNALGTEAANALATVLSSGNDGDGPESYLSDVDVSSNSFSTEDMRAITKALQQNGKISSIDLRRNAYVLSEEERNDIERVCRQNELKLLQKKE